MEDYYPDSMKKDEFEKFQKWYKENNDTPFLLEDQLKIYCGQDTEILLKAVLAMRKIFIEITMDELSPNGFDMFKVNYFTSYPVKTPKIIIPKTHDVMWQYPEDIPYDGLLKVRAIPPKNLKIPLLPFHADSILFFTNCSKCCQRAKPDFVFVKNVKKCKHTDTERGLHGVFTNIELKLAMELGYKIDKFYRVYHFEEFDSNLFKGYVRKFLKLKVESSGWPSNVTSDEQKINFINEYKRIFDIIIDPKNMEYNTGMRFISKLLLNSLWGKFGMRNKLSKNKIINRPSEYFELLFNHKIILSKPILINEGVIRVVFREKDEFVGPHSVSNIIIALWY